MCFSRREGACIAARQRVSAQLGLSLVELMVAMTIGLIVVLIATTAYLQGIGNARFRSGQSENLNNSRYALGTLEGEFTKAGYRRDPTQPMDEAFPADTASHPNGCQFSTGQAIYAADASTLCIRYQARDNNERDCAGSTAGIGGLKAYEAPSLPARGAGLFVEKYAFQDGVLVCTAGDLSADTAVADGVRGAVFEFGVGKGTDSFAERHVEAFKTTSPSSDDAIRSLRYAILLSASEDRVTGGLGSSVCDRWKGLGGEAANCDIRKGQLYQLASGSLTLRNLMP